MPKGIKSFQKGHPGYNKGGLPLSETHKRKISKSMEEQYRSGKRKPQNPMEGKTWSDAKKKWFSENAKKKGFGKWMTGKHHTLKTRLKLRQLHLGNKAPMWKGGITPINARIRDSLKYKLWREAVFKRDNSTCIFCGARNGNCKKVILNADHIKPFAFYPKLRFKLNNGRTLCLDCHKKTFSYKKQFGESRNQY